MFLYRVRSRNHPVKSAANIEKYFLLYYPFHLETKAYYIRPNGMALALYIMYTHVIQTGKTTVIRRIAVREFGVSRQLCVPYN